MSDPTSTPPMERARGDGWGGDGARDAIRQIAEDLRQRTGFGTCEVEVAPLQRLYDRRGDAPDAVVISQPANPSGVYLSHEELMARGGQYSELYNIQAAAYR